MRALMINQDIFLHGLWENFDVSSESPYKKIVYILYVIRGFI
jgi:hypothetical protein